MGRFLLNILYDFLKAVVKMALFAFYPKTTVVGRKHLRQGGPNITVSNHPNTLLDPMNVAGRLRQRAFFLANSGLFDTPFKEKLLRTLYCIPIVRKQDTGGRHINNKASFASAIEFLGKGGCLYVAPEGSSYQERHLRQVKSGTARIALATEEEHDFKLGLVIRCVGLTYEKPHQPFTSLMVRSDEPIRVADFADAYHANPRAAIHALTERITQQLSSLIVNTDSEAQDELLHRMEIVQQNDNPLPPVAHFERAQATLSQLKTLPAAEHEQLEKQYSAYFSALAEIGSSDAAVKRGRLPWGKGLLLLLTFPVFLYGWFNHLAQWYLPRLIIRKTKPYIGYWSTVQWMLLIVLFPLLYGLQSWIVALVLGPPWRWIYLASLLLTGPLAVAWHQQWLSWRAHWAFARLSAEERANLQRQRTDGL